MVPRGGIDILKTHPTLYVVSNGMMAYVITTLLISSKIVILMKNRFPLRDFASHKIPS